MGKTIAPIGITAGQIGRAADCFSERCRINASSLPKDTVQVILEDEGDALAQEMFEVFRARVERRANIIVRRVPVNRNRTPEEALKATGRTQYADISVVSSMPKGESDHTEIFFFKPRPEAYKNGWLSEEALEKEFEFQGLNPADPYSLAAVNEADPAFAEEHPNGTHWKDTNDKWCYAAFNRWRGGRRVIVDRGGDGWGGGWWLAGLRK